MRGLTLAVILWVCGFTLSARGEIKTWKITGTVESINAYEMKTITAPFAVGDPFVHIFTIDDLAPLSEFNDPPDAAYNTAVIAAEFRIPSRGFSVESISSGTVILWNKIGDLWGTYLDGTILSTTHTSVGTGMSGDDIQLSFLRMINRVPSPGFQDNLVPPLSQPNPKELTIHFLEWRHEATGGDGSYTLAFKTDSFVAIPEPATRTLCGLAILLIGSRCLPSRFATQRTIL